MTCCFSKYLSEQNKLICCSVSGFVIFTSREAAWSSRTVGQKKKRKRRLMGFSAIAQPLFWQLLSIIVPFIDFLKKIMKF